MPTIRETYNAFESIVGEQDRAILRVRDEIKGLERTASEALDRARNAVADLVRDGFRQPADFDALARTGNAVPRSEHARLVADRDRQRSNLSESINKLNGQAARVSQEATQARAETEAIDRTADELEAFLAKAQSLPEAFRRGGALPNLRETLETLLAEEERIRKPGLLERLARDGRLARKAAADYAASTGRDLYHDARSWSEHRKTAERQRGVVETLNAAVRRDMGEVRRLEEALHGLPDDGALFVRARATAVESSLSRSGLAALRGVLGDRLPPSVLAEVARSDQMQDIARRVSAQLDEMTKFRDQLAKNLPKLRKGKSAAPSKHISVDLEAIRRAHEALKAGMGRQADGLRALMKANREIERRWHETDWTPSRRPAEDLSLPAQMDAMSTTWLLILLDAATDDARCLVPHMTALAPEKLAVVCADLPPDALDALRDASAVQTGLGAGIDVGNINVATPNVPDVPSFLVPDVPNIQVPDIQVSVPDIPTVSVDTSSSFSGGFGGVD